MIRNVAWPAISNVEPGANTAATSCLRRCDPERRSIADMEKMPSDGIVSRLSTTSSTPNGYLVFLVPRKTG